MTTPIRPVARARSAFYRAFYRLPGRWRRRLVRVATPKFIVGGVVLVRDSEAAAPGRLLLLRQPPGYGWSLPAGLLKKGEPPVGGAARELLEETGVRGSPEDLTPAEPSAVVHHRGRGIDVGFEARVPAGGQLAVDGAEVVAAVGDRAHMSVESGPRPLGTAGGFGALRDWIDGRPVLVGNVDAYLAGGDLAPLLDGWDGDGTRLLVACGPPVEFSGRRFAGCSAVPWRRVRGVPADPADLGHTEWRPPQAAAERSLVENDGRDLDSRPPARD